MSPLAMFAIAGALTFALRYFAVGLVSRGVTISADTEETLRLVAPAVLTAIAVNSLVIDGGSLNTRWEWYVAVAIAAIGWWRTRSTGVAFVLGFAVVSLLNLIS